MSALGSVQMLLLAAALFLLAAGIVGSLAVPVLLRWTAQWAPASRHRALAVIAIAPITLGLTALLSVMLPSLLGFYWPVYDHCLVHGGHSHLCFAHPAQHGGAWAGWALVASASLWLAAQLIRGARSLLRSSRVLRGLGICARYDVARSFWVLPSSDALCLSAGLLRPRLFASEGLLAKASAEELEIMLAHEHAHARRMDSLVRLVARSAASLLMPGARARLLAALQLAAEQACDEVAVLRSGDRLRVAETILSVERKMHAPESLHCSPLIASFGASSVPDRVAAMLEPPRHASACTLLVAVLIGIAVSVLAAHDHLHHATESLLGAFSH